MASPRAPRYALASFIAPLPALALAAALGLWELATGQNRPGDNAPVRAAFLVVLLTPFAYLFLSLVLVGVTRFLAARRLLSRRVLLGTAVCVSLALASAAGVASPFGLADALETFAILAAALILASTVMVLTWWWVAKYSSTPDPASLNRP